MAFVVPAFPLAVSIWRVAGIGGAYAAPDVSTVGNLSPGRRGMIWGQPASSNLQAKMPMELLLPKLTDIRATWNNTTQDVVEVPAGSKRFYTVVDVDDIGKGFANEHRFALISASVGTPGVLYFGFTFPVPLP